MAASPPCNCVGAAMEKLGRLMRPGVATHRAEGSLHAPLLNSNSMSAIQATANQSGGHPLAISQLTANKATQASRLASVAVAATVWVGFSMCSTEALAAAFDGAGHGDQSSLLNASAGMLRLSENVEISEMDMELGFHDRIRAGHFNTEMEEGAVGHEQVPPVKPPNEGLNSPWLVVPKMNGLNRKDDSSRGPMRCPKWTLSELEMVLPDLQGQPKPFPRMQGRLYPFWPAAAAPTGDADDGDDSLVDLESMFANGSAAALSMRDDGTGGASHGHMLSRSSVAPSPHQNNMPSYTQALGCFSM